MTTLITPDIQDYFNGSAMIHYYYSGRTSKFEAEFGIFKSLNGSLRRCSMCGVRTTVPLAEEEESRI